MNSKTATGERSIVRGQPGGPAPGGPARDAAQTPHAPQSVDDTSLRDQGVGEFAAGRSSVTNSIVASEVDDQDSAIKKIGLELHDMVAQDFATVILLAEQLKMDFKRPQKVADAGDRINRIENAARHAFSIIRNYSRGLLSEHLENKTLLERLDQIAQSIESIYGTSCFIDYSSTITFAIPNTVSEHLFRFAQEAANNAVRHGKAKKLEFHVKYETGGLHLSLSDDGSGFNGLAAEQSPGIGLRQMAARAKVLGAQWHIQRRSPQGTACTIYVPDEALGRDRVNIG